MLKKLLLDMETSMKLNLFSYLSIHPCIKYKGESKKKKSKKRNRERYTGEFRLLPCFSPPISFIENQLNIHNLLEKSDLNCINNSIKDFMLEQGT